MNVPSETTLKKLTEEYMENLSDEDRIRDLLILTDKLQLAKEAEQCTKDYRISIEKHIATYIPTKEVGQKTKTLSDGTKVTVKRALNYKANLLAIRELFSDNRAKGHAPIKSSTTEVLDVPGYEWHRKNNPYIFSELSKLVEVKPKKVSVIIQEPKE